MKIVGLCGSLRSGSFNAAVLRTASDLTVAPREFVLWPDLGLLPFFNSDVEQSVLPDIVAELRAMVGESDGVLIASPEYAHGTSGVLKNALEWLVGGGDVTAKPIALVSASTTITGGDQARAWLTQTLTVMGARVIAQDLRIAQAVGKFTDGRVTDEPTVAALRDLLDALTEAAAEAREDADNDTFA